MVHINNKKENIKAAFNYDLAEERPDAVEKHVPVAEGWKNEGS